VLLAITNEGKVWVGVLAGLFILFAILSAFVLPRRNPDFPGNRLGLFVLVTVVLFIGTMSGIVFFAKEEEGHGAEAAETHTTEGEGGPARPEDESEGGETTTESTTTEESTTGESEEAGGGDAAAGEQVFASAGCASCHTLEAAGASGTVGPNLDEAKPDHDLVVERVTNGMGAMPSFEDQLSEQQIQDVAAYVVESTS
jgi:mono/diheme cytochrome c family protein